MSKQAKQSKQSKKPAVSDVVLESGIAVKPVYTAEDVEASGGYEGVGRPGEFPFTRGIHPTMYRSRPWTMRQYSGFGTAEETRERFKFLIETGNTGLNVAFDLPTQIGLDSDDPMAAGEVGRVGMAVDSLADMELAFEGIDLDRITVSLTINGAATTLIAMYAALADKRGYDLTKLRGTAQNDILKEFVARSTWIYPVEPSVKLVGDTIEWCAQHMPKYSPVSVCGYHIREAGANPVQEMAYAFCIAKAYIDHTLERGVSIDEFAGRLSFNFDIFGNFFEQIAKFRAGRRLWARIVTEDYGAQNPRSGWLRMIAGGGGGGLTIEEPENNIARSAYYALISALSGTQTMALCSYDEAYTIPTEKAARISLRTMQILMHEMGLCDTVDPLGGSYYVETLTNQMEDKIRETMAEVDAQGGIVQAIAEGRIQAAVARQAYEFDKGLQDGTIPKVGVNRFRDEREAAGAGAGEVEFHPYREQDAAKQRTRLGEVRDSRDADRVKQTLAELRAAAERGDNVMVPTIAAVKAYATVGEITAVLKEVYGGFQEPITF
jgi:methylmalonyl-CoA mutase N-terminal domain/subunit